jgi:hypothetical protein
VRAPIEPIHGGAPHADPSDQCRSAAIAAATQRSGDRSLSQSTSVLDPVIGGVAVLQRREHNRALRWFRSVTAPASGSGLSEPIMKDEDDGSGMASR